MTASWTGEDRDTVRERVRVAAALPGVEIDESNGHTGFSVRGKRFAWLLVDHQDDGRLALCVKAPAGEQEALVGRGGCWFVPAYLGSCGWVGVDLAPAAGADWDEVTALVERAWAMTAPNRLVAQLGAPGGDASWRG